MNTVNLDGGEFEDNPHYCTPIDQLPLLIDRIGSLLVNIKPELKDPDKVLYYCFKVSANDKMILGYVLKGLYNRLSKGCSFYQVEGKEVFDIRGASGGIVTACCFYLIVK